MRTVSKFLLVAMVVIMSVQNTTAKNGFLEAFSRLCTENELELEKFTSFFTKEGIDLNEVLDPQLYINIFNWMHTPYRYGGKSEKGIDCSNYVFKLNSECQNNYATSYQLAQITTYIDPTELQEGDLVFFNVHGGGISHVGIYLQDGKFTHSSTSEGVIISNLDEPYWAKRFCRAGRIPSTYYVNQ
jgi:lipoprotein Spr